MRNKPLLFLTLGVLALTACSYNPFNDFTGIDISNQFGITQYDDKLIWDRNEECDYYELYVESKSSSSKASSSSAKKTPALKTTNCYASVDSNWVGSKVKVVGYSIEGLEEKKVCQTNTINVVNRTTRVGTVSNPTKVKLINSSTTIKDNLISIDSTIDEVDIEDVSLAARLNFSSRQDGSSVKIVLNSAKITGKEGIFTYPVFNYLGSNKNVNFIFSLNGTNTITGGILSASGDDASSAIKLPNVIFYSGSGSLTVTGGRCAFKGTASGKDNPGYAIQANKVVSFLEKEQIKLIGGNGGKGEAQYINGGKGQMPMNSGVKVQTAKKATIGLRAGDGGAGGPNANGGNTYSYSYLVNKAYKKYTPSFYLIEQAVPGAAGSGGVKGTFIVD